MTQVSWGAIESNQRTACVCGLSDVGDVHCFDETDCVSDGNTDRWGRVISNATRVEVGVNHGCAINEFRSVNCWGDHTKGQLGIGDVLPDGIANRLVEGLSSGIVSIDASINYACALSDAGVVQCWGENWGWGQGFSVLNGQSAVLDTAGPSILY